MESWTIPLAALIVSITTLILTVINNSKRNDREGYQELESEVQRLREERDKLLAANEASLREVELLRKLNIEQQQLSHKGR